MDRTRVVKPSDIRTLAEIKAAGHSVHGVQKRLARGSLHRLWRGCYIETELWKELTPERRALARRLAYFRVTTAEITYSHTSAAIVHGLSLLRVPRQLHISGHPRPTPNNDLVKGHHLIDVADERVLSDAGLPATSLARTALDCARTLPELDALVILDQLLARGVTADDLRQRIARSRGTHGNRRAGAVIDQSDARSGSVAETLARHRLRRAGLPEPELQFPIMTHRGRYFVDFAWPSLMLILEIDGDIKYRDYAPVAEVVMHERAREKAIQNQGWLVLRATWRDLHEGWPSFLARLREIVVVREAARGIQSAEVPPRTRPW